MKSVEKENIVINHKLTAEEAIKKLNNSDPYFILFVVADDGKMIGTLTDGDIRREIIKGRNLKTSVKDFMNYNFRFLNYSANKYKDFQQFKKSKLKLIPLLDDQKKIITIIDSNSFNALLPVDAVIMAGGEGNRLSPLTDNLPKPLLNVGDKPILGVIIDWVSNYGINDFYFPLFYQSEKIVQYLNANNTGKVNFNTVLEKEPMGTMGGITMIDSFAHDYILLLNADLLTNINLENLFAAFIDNHADLIVASLPYHVTVPYAVFEINEDKVLSLKEKPTYTYYSNGGVYLFKRSLLNLIPKNTKYDTPEFIDVLIKNNYKVISYPVTSYWLDIGRIEDYKRAQEDIKYVVFN